MNLTDDAEAVQVYRLRTGMRMNGRYLAVMDAVFFLVAVQVVAVAALAPSDFREAVSVVWLPIVLCALVLVVANAYYIRNRDALLAIYPDGVSARIGRLDGWYPWLAFKGPGRITRFPGAPHGLMFAETGGRSVPPAIAARFHGIPLDAFERNWMNASIGQHIRQFAPGLLDGDEAWRAPA